CGGVVRRDLRDECGLVLPGAVQQSAVAYRELFGDSVASGEESGWRIYRGVPCAEATEEEYPRVDVGWRGRYREQHGKLADEQYPAGEQPQDARLRFSFPVRGEYACDRA